MNSLWTTRNITLLDGLRYEAIDSLISQNIFLYLKMFSMQIRKNITVEDNKKIMNIANFINIYTNIHTYTFLISSVYYKCSYKLRFDSVKKSK